MTTDTTHADPSVAITGAGSGLGREIAIRFADKGYRVFGTARTPQEIEDAREATHGVADLTICDITDEDAVRGWAKDASDALGDAVLPDRNRSSGDGDGERLPDQGLRERSTNRGRRLRWSDSAGIQASPRSSGNSRGKSGYR